MCRRIWGSSALEPNCGAGVEYDIDWEWPFCLKQNVFVLFWGHISNDDPHLRPRCFKVFQCVAKAETAICRIVISLTSRSIIVPSSSPTIWRFINGKFILRNVPFPRGCQIFFAFVRCTAPMMAVDIHGSFFLVIYTRRCMKRTLQITTCEFCLEKGSWGKSNNMYIYVYIYRYTYINR